MPTLDFKGKPFVYSHHLSVPYRELIVDKDKSLPPNGEEPSLDDNLIIHGDNLEALKALLPRYAGKVDVIYIDPPYNTGKDEWRYDDRVNSPQMQSWLGTLVNKEDLELDGRLGAYELRDIFAPEKANFKNPKPSELIKHLLAFTAQPDAIVLDSFAGSGTTAHAVLSLNSEDKGDRKFILVETEDYADALTAERVRRVISGASEAKDESLKNGLGGSFAYCELGEAMDLERFFAEDGKAPAFDQVASYVAYTSTGETLAPAEGPDGFAGHAGNYRLHLLYRPNPGWMRSNEAMLDLTTAERIAGAAKADGRKPVLVFAAGKLMGQRVLTGLGLTFCQLPYSVHRILGDGAQGVAGVDAA